MTIDELIQDATRRMDRSVEAAHGDFNTLRTGRASAALLDRIQIDYYGQKTPLNQLATINVPEPRMLTIQPFDPTSIKAIEKAIQESDLGLTPSNDGKLIRLPMPQPNEERRKELVKVVRKLAEEGKVAIRNVRRDAMHHLQELSKQGDVGDDDERRAEERVQKMTDDHTKSIEDLLKHKEAEIMEVCRKKDRRLSLLTKIRTLRHVRPAPEPDLPNVARAVAIVMDGNGRWARRRGLPVAAGHRAGTKALRRTVEAAIDLGVESLAVYAFSTENWNRPPDEVELLMEIFTETIERELPDLVRQGVRTRFVGRRDRAPSALRDRMEALEVETASNRRLQLWIAFDYGGRAEIVEAARRAVEAGVELDEDSFASFLYAPEMPDPDLLIRTSGELRISNFLLWQLAYAELVFVDTLWPDFGEEQLRSALDDYASRRRRFGGR